MTEVSLNAIDAEAAAWAVKLDRRLQPEERVALDAWLAGDRRRRGALVRAQAVFSLAAIDLEHAAPERPRLRRRWILVSGLGVAASVAAGVLIAPALRRQRLSTRVGEIRRVPLEDGSLAAINTDTVVEVALQPRERKIAIERGEAWFQVAKDAARPFVVEAGPVRVQALGTAFSVRRKALGAQVLVTEGVVEVWSVGQAGGDRRRVKAGEQVFIGDKAGAARPVSRPLEADRALAWRDGQIVLDGDTVAAAAAEFNRYNARKIIISDPALEGRRVVGWFRTNEPDSFAEAVAIAHGVSINASTSVIVLGG
jgi:Fe2+-dicitrate sensor, membrane component